MSKSEKEDWYFDLDNDPYYSKETLSITVDDDLTVTNVDTVTLDSDVTFSFDDTIVIGDGTTSVTTQSTDWVIDTNVDVAKWGLSTDTITVPWENNYTLWRDCLPSLTEVEAMCKEYPALEKAFENFKTIYKMVEQDYKGKKENDT